MLWATGDDISAARELVSVAGMVFTPFVKRCDEMSAYIVGAKIRGSERAEGAVKEVSYLWYDHVSQCVSQSDEKEKSLLCSFLRLQKQLNFRGDA